MLRLPKKIFAVFLLTGIACSCSPRPYCHLCAHSGPAVYENGTVTLDGAEYYVTFTNTATASSWIDDDGRLLQLSIPDQAVTEISVRRTRPEPLTEDDAMTAYSVASQYCRSLRRRPDAAETRNKGYFHIRSGSWIFQEVCE